MPARIDGPDVAIGGRLGSGMYGTVYRGVYRAGREGATGREVAVKHIPPFDCKGRSNRDMIERETTTWRMLSSDARNTNISRMIDVVDLDVQGTYIISELGNPSSLHTRLYSDRDDDVAWRRNRTIADKIRILHDVLLGIYQCHRNHVAHCDIKPANVVEMDAGWKLVDFGHSQRCETDDHGLYLTRFTPFYMAPEVLSYRCYGRNVDIWALGVIAFIMFNHGNHPMISAAQAHQAVGGASHVNDTCNVRVPDYTIKTIHDCIILGNIYWQQQAGGRELRDLKDFVQRCLVVQPSKRMSAEDALGHPLFDAPN